MNAHNAFIKTHPLLQIQTEKYERLHFYTTIATILLPCTNTTTTPTVNIDLGSVGITGGVGDSTHSHVYKRSFLSKNRF